MDEMNAILNKAVEVGLNAIVFQVRPGADAMYKSDLEPWSWYLTEEQGKAPAEGWDPLEAWVEGAHKRGLELHAWLNPYRALHPAQKGPVADSHISHKLGEAVPAYGDYLWMDPSSKEVQDHSFAVFMDIVERYDVDGLHIDDYFYPYPITKNKEKVDFPDDPSWNRYRASGGKLSKGDWRRDGVNKFIQRVYAGMKERKPWVQFGISPFGIYRPGVPPTIQAGIDQYDELYADARLWLREGWCDYFTPQLYWPIEQTPQSFPVLLEYWASENPKGRHLWPGQFTSRMNPDSGNWEAKELIAQIELVRDQQGAEGTIHFSMKAIMNNWNGCAYALRQAYKGLALTPSSAWLGSEAPGRISKATVADGWVTIETDDQTARFVAIYAETDTGWQLVRVGQPHRPILAPELQNSRGMAALVSRTSLLGPAAPISAE
jgi:uncharacterized lipoprotein YddW (UPF0748 family)